MRRYRYPLNAAVRALAFGIAIGMPAAKAVAVGPDCDSAAITPAAIRGAGVSQVPREGASVVVRGTVSARFAGLDGFYIQNRAADGEPVGLFVYAPERSPEALPQPGREVRVAAKSGRYHGRIQLEAVRRITQCGRAEPGVAPRVLQLPASARRLERLEDTLVRVPRGLRVSGNDELARYGSLRLAAGGRRYRGEPPGAGEVPVRLDDGAYRRDPEPVPYLNAIGTRRNGSELGRFRAVLDYAFGAWRLHPIGPVPFVEDNERPRVKPRQAWLRVVSWNVHNFYAVTKRRGPRSDAGQRRQRAGIRATLQALDADVLLLQEIENRPGVLRVLRKLVQQGARGITYKVAGASRAPRGEIRVAVLYRPARLSLQSVAFLRDPVHERPPLAVVLKPEGGRRLGIIALHFKSKGGCPAGQPKGTAAGCWGARREQQALSVGRWLGHLRERTGVATWLVGGDLNSYPGEPPTERLRAAGLMALVARHRPGGAGATYVWHGVAGTLDHALATRPLAARVADTWVWHAQADEPPGIDFPGPWGASDHDPVVVELDRR